MYFLSLVGISVGIPAPLEPPLLERVDLLDERHLDVEARFREGLADRLAELRDDDLLGLADGVQRRGEREQAEDDGGGEAQEFHHLASCLTGSRFNKGRRPFIEESMMSFRPVFGSTSLSVSR